MEMLNARYWMVAWALGACCSRSLVQRLGFQADPCDEKFFFLRIVSISPYVHFVPGERSIAKMGAQKKSSRFWKKEFAANSFFQKRELFFCASVRAKNCALAPKIEKREMRK